MIFKYMVRSLTLMSFIVGSSFLTACNDRNLDKNVVKMTKQKKSELDNLAKKGEAAEAKLAEAEKAQIAAEEALIKSQALYDESESVRLEEETRQKEITQERNLLAVEKERFSQERIAELEAHQLALAKAIEAKNLAEVERDEIISQLEQEKVSWDKQKALVEGDVAALEQAKSDLESQIQNLKDNSETEELLSKETLLQQTDQSQKRTEQVAQITSSSEQRAEGVRDFYKKNSQKFNAEQQIFDGKLEDKFIVQFKITVVGFADVRTLNIVRRNLLELDQRERAQQFKPTREEARGLEANIMSKLDQGIALTEKDTNVVVTDILEVQASKSLVKSVYERLIRIVAEDVQSDLFVVVSEEL